MPKVWRDATTQEIGLFATPSINRGTNMISDQQKDWQRCVAFHGHECPGLAIGFKAARLAQRLLEVDSFADEELVCVTENDACGVDAVQVLTGCTMGKGNLIFRDTGKMAFSFFLRSTKKSLRLIFSKQFDRQKMDMAARQEAILSAADDEIFTTGTPSFAPPERARIFTSVICESCGEGAPEHKMRLDDGKKVCLDCCPAYSRGW